MITNEELAQSQNHGHHSHQYAQQPQDQVNPGHQQEVSHLVVEESKVGAAGPNFHPAQQVQQMSDDEEDEEEGNENGVNDSIISSENFAMEAEDPHQFAPDMN